MDNAIALKSLMVFVPEAPGALYPGIQKRENNYHIALREIPNNLLVPPWNEKWPSAAFGTKSLLPDLFLEILLSTADAIEIMKWEIATETYARRYIKEGQSKVLPEALQRGRAKTIKAMPFKWQTPKWDEIIEYAKDNGILVTRNFQEQISWMSWSALLQLELSVQSRGCTNFYQCLIYNFFENVNDEFDPALVNTKWIETTTGRVLRFFDSVQRLVEATLSPIFYEDSAGWLRDSAHKYVSRYLSIKPGDDALRSPWFRHLFSTDEKKAIGLVQDIHAHFRQTPEAMAMTKKIADDRLRRTLQMPNIVHESSLNDAFYRLLLIIYKGQHTNSTEVPNFAVPLGDVGTFDPNNKEDTRRCTAALLLCQVAVGSRARGIIAVNQIEKANFHLADEQLGDNKEALQRAYASFLDVLITVHRLTKSKNPQTQAILDYLVSKKNEDIEDKMEVEEGETDEQYDKIITKPLLYQLFWLPWFHRLDPVRLLDAQYAIPGGTTGDIRNVFFDLLRSVRERVLKGPEAAEAKIQPKDVGYFGTKNQLSISDKTKDSQAVTFLVKAWVARMNRMVKDIFPPGVNTGTHDMRRLYVAYGYELFAKNTMKEVGWTNRVLAHDSIEVSNVYTSLKIVNGVPAEKLTDLDAIRKQIQGLTDDIKRLRTEYHTWNETRKGVPVTLTNLFGEQVTIEKLPRSKRSATLDDKLDRGLQAARSLYDRGVPISSVNLVALGVPKTGHMTAMILELPEVMELSLKQKV